MWALTTPLDIKHEKLCKPFRSWNDSLPKYIYGNNHGVSLFVIGGDLKAIQCGNDILKSSPSNDNALQVLGKVDNGMKNIELKFLKDRKPMVTSKIAIKDITKGYIEECKVMATYVNKPVKATISYGQVRLR